MSLSREEWGAAIPVGLVVISALFLALIAYLIAGSLTRREIPTFPLSGANPKAVPAAASVLDTVTIDSRDTRSWAFLDFDRRAVVRPPDTAGWDLAVRRFRLIAADAIADLGAVVFDSVLEATDTGYVGNIVAGDTVNPATRRWYRYGLFSHLLEPREHVYVVRTADGRYAKLEILSYYCPGLVAGCMTVRYFYPLSPTPRR